MSVSVRAFSKKGSTTTTTGGGCCTGTVTSFGPTTFAAVGGLASTTGSFANYAAALVSDVASKSSQASADYTVKQTAQTTYANSLSSQSGVNLDEETNRLSSLQNKYSAASELIQVINTMFSTLLTAMQSM